MNRLSTQYPLLILVALLLSSCDTGITGESIPGTVLFKSERSPYFLNGTVTDGKGFPVAGAEIHSMMKWGPLKNTVPRIPYKTMPSTSVAFSVPEAGDVSLKIFRLGTRELIATLLEGTVQPGNYVAQFDAKSVTNGFYVYQLVTKRTFTEKLMVLQIDEVNALVQTTPLTRTDAEGKFRLPVSIFGFDEEISVTNEMGPTVLGHSSVDSIAIVVFQSGKHPLVQWMSVNKYSTMEQSYILQ